MPATDGTVVFAIGERAFSRLRTYEALASEGTIDDRIETVHPVVRPCIVWLLCRADDGGRGDAKRHHRSRHVTSLPLSRTSRADRSVVARLRSSRRCRRARPRHTRSPVRCGRHRHLPPVGKKRREDASAVAAAIHGTAAGPDITDVLGCGRIATGTVHGRRPYLRLHREETAPETSKSYPGSLNGPGIGSSERGQAAWPSNRISAVNLWTATEWSRSTRASARRWTPALRRRTGP